MRGFTSTLITKCIFNMRPVMRAAAEVFIYIKRLSTYIIRIITNENFFSKEIAFNDTSSNISQFQVYYTIPQ